jgi:hypothetical protein
VLLAATVVALHDVSVAIARVAAAPEAFAGGVGSFALALPFEVGEGIILSPHEPSVASSLSFSLSFAFGALVLLEEPPELPHRAPSESAPGAFSAPELQIDVFGGVSLRKVLQARNVGNLFVS